MCWCLKSKRCPSYLQSLCDNELETFLSCIHYVFSSMSQPLLRSQQQITPAPVSHWTTEAPVFLLRALLLLNLQPRQPVFTLIKEQKIFTTLKMFACRYASHSMCETADVYEYRHVCVQILHVCTVCLPLPNCKTGLRFIFVMWKQGSVLLKQTSAKNRPTHLALIKTAWLYSCSCSDLQASGKSQEKENTDVCMLHRHTHTHLNKRSNSFINNCRKCVLWGEGAADLTVATALMNNRQDNQ